MSKTNSGCINFYDKKTLLQRIITSFTWPFYCYIYLLILPVRVRVLDIIYINIFLRVKRGKKALPRELERVLLFI